MADVSLQSLFDRARQALDMGDAEQAGAIARHALRYAPDVIEGHHILGEAYLNAGQTDQAIAAFEAVLRVDPENIAAYYGLGLAHQRRGHGLGAIRAFERALEIQPNLAELRAQLLQLYAETPGSAGQFRLSRAGLGRLYARGQMFAQAVDEFRAVLDNDPERDDVRVALAEALWRDGQEDEAAGWCRDTLKRRAELFKPTLILGYLQLAAGQPEGETLWRRAASQEPGLQTAQALFDILPPLRIEEPKVPPFDVQAWRDEQDRLAAAPPEPAPAVVADGDFSEASWPVSAAVQAPVAPTAPPAQRDSRATLSDDDLLASLLGFGDADAGVLDEFSDLERVPPATPTDLTSSPSAPSTPDEIAAQVGQSDRAERAVDAQEPSSGDSEAGAAASSAPPEAEEPEAASGSAHLYEAAPPAPTPVEPGDDHAPRPFNIEDVDDEVFPFDPAPRPAPGEAGAALGSVQPFSLQDWDLQDDEPVGASAPDAALAAEDTTRFKPFSLEELSLDALNTDHSDFLAGPSADEREAQVADSDAAVEQPPSHDQQPPAPEVTESATNEAPPSTGEAEDEVEPEPTPETPQPVPFSFADLGLDEDDFAVLDIDDTSEADAAQAESVTFSEHTSATDIPSGPPAASPFDLSELGLIDDEPVEALDVDVAAPAYDHPDQDEMTPFSLADLGLSDEELAQLGLATVTETVGAPETVPAAGTGTPVDQEETTPFSLADLGLSDEELELFSVTGDEGSETHATGGTSTTTPPETEPFETEPVWGSPDIESSLAVSTGWEALETETGDAPAAEAPADDDPETAPIPPAPPPKRHEDHE
jgi:tetratricopeptide (TPR) repeat protein